MHLDEERLQRLLHGELSQSAETAAREHLASCAECRERFRVAEREEERVDALLRQLDDRAPALDVSTVVSRARATSRDSGLLLRAASFVLTLGVMGVVYAAYAAPGSPLKVWVATIVQWIGGHPEAKSTVSPPSPDSRMAGIAVAPGPDLLILFTAPEVGSRVQITLSERSDVSVHAPIGAARFTSDADRLLIQNRDAYATFVIEIPHAAPRVEIRVGQSRLFLKEGPHVTATEAPGLTGSYLLRLAPP